MVNEFELQLADGSYVTQRESNGLAACHLFADNHPGVTVVAWRGPLMPADRMDFPHTVITTERKR